MVLAGLLVAMMCAAGDSPSGQSQPAERPPARLGQRLEKRIENLQQRVEQRRAAQPDEDSAKQATGIARAVEFLFSKVLDAPTKIGGIRMDLKNDRLELTDLRIGNPKGFDEGDVIQLEKAVVEAPIESFFGKNPQIRLIEADGITVNAEASLQKGMNLKTLMDNAKQFTGKAGGIKLGGGSEKKWRIDKGVLGGATLNLTTDLLAKKTMTRKIGPIEMSFPGADGKGVLASDALAQVLQRLLKETQMFGGQGAPSPLTELLGTILGAQ